MSTSGRRAGEELPPELATAQGRRGWLRQAKRRLDNQRAEEARPIPASRQARLKEAKRRLDEELEVECRANAAYEAYRAHGRAKDGRRFGRPPDPWQPPRHTGREDQPHRPRLAQSQDRARLGSGLQRPAAVTAGQIVIAAEVTVDSPDFGHLEPMVAATERELATAGIDRRPEVLLADAGYWHQAQMQAIVNRGIEVLVPPDADRRKGERAGWQGGAYAFMRRALETDRGGALYAKRQGMIEPVFGDAKFKPPLRPLPTPRQIRRPLGMAPHHRHPQPPGMKLPGEGSGGGVRARGWRWGHRAKGFRQRDQHPIRTPLVITPGSFIWSA